VLHGLSAPARSIEDCWVCVDSSDKSVETISELLAELKDAGIADQPHAHTRHWFRGHAHADWGLTPQVYRPAFISAYGDETKRLRKEQHLNQDFRVLSAGIRSGDETDAELYFLQQHYGLPTRLLDWSTVPLAVLYFAVSKQEHDETDGQIVYMDAYQLAPTQHVSGD
jgi:hypothetical protein